MFERDETQTGHPVIDRIKPECQWVLDGEGVATAKLDGTNIKIEGGEPFKRQKPRDRDYDEAAYVPCVRSDPADQWAWEAFDALTQKGAIRDGVFELIGPKVQGNPHRVMRHQLVQVVPPGPVVRGITVSREDRTYTGLRSWLRSSEFEGLVFHHPDGRMAKIKRRDFGLSWPLEPARATSQE